MGSTKWTSWIINKSKEKEKWEWEAERVHSFSSSTWEVEAGRALSSRPDWSTELVPGQPGCQGYTERPCLPPQKKNEKRRRRKRKEDVFVHLKRVEEGGVQGIHDHISLYTCMNLRMKFFLSVWNCSLLLSLLRTITKWSTKGSFEQLTLGLDLLLKIFFMISSKGQFNIIVRTMDK